MANDRFVACLLLAVVLHLANINGGAAQPEGPDSSASSAGNPPATGSIPDANEDGSSKVVLQKRNLSADDELDADSDVQKPNQAAVEPVQHAKQLLTYKYNLNLYIDWLYMY